MAGVNNKFEWRRRRALAALGGVSLGTAAGCLGDDDDDVGVTDIEEIEDDFSVDIDDIDDPDSQIDADAFVENQEYRLTTQENLEQLMFVFSFEVGIGMGAIDDHTYSWFPWGFRPVLNGLGGWTKNIHMPFRHDPGEVYPGLVADWEVAPEKISFRIRDEANWSDGEPITARDVAYKVALHRDVVTWESIKDYFDNPEENPQLNFAIEDINFPDGIDGKEVELLHWDFDEYPQFREYGGFRGHPEWPLWTMLVLHWGRWGISVPFHEEPWKSMGESRWEAWQEHYLPSEEEYDRPDLFERVEPYVTAEDLHRSREPGGIPRAGPWQLAEPVDETQVTLEPNYEHYAADQFNFERLIIEYAPEDHRRLAGLEAGRYDYDSLDLGPEMLEILGEDYDIMAAPAGQGYAIHLDHAAGFRERRLRQAMMYCLNKQEIVDVTNPILAEPITVPGWHHHGADVFFDEEWAQENLIDYSQDIDRASELMQEVGYERGDEYWERDGEVLQFTIATPSTSPIFEETVASQFQSFGLDASVQTFDPTTFSERVEGSDRVEEFDRAYGGAGDFAAWTNTTHHDQIAGWLPDNLPRYWGRMVNPIWQARMTNFFEHDVQEPILAQYGGDGWASGLEDEEAQEPFYIMLPPIGEPHAEPDLKYHLAFSELDGTPLHLDQELKHKIAAWAVNWWMPALPLALSNDPHLLNNLNWNYPTDHDMWEYFGTGWGIDEVAGLNEIQADPDNLKVGAEIRDEDDD